MLTNIFQRYLLNCATAYLRNTAVVFKIFYTVRRLLSVPTI